MKPVPPSSGAGSPSPLASEGEVPWDRLGRLLTGELSAEEEAHVRHWLAADPEREQLIADLRTVWAYTKPGGPSRDPEQVLEVIRRQDASLVRHRAFAAIPPAPVPVWRRFRHALAAAAALGGLTFGGWWLVRSGSPGRPSSMRTVSAVVEHRTGRGQRLALMLPDGSSVVLGPESSLRYAAGYGTADRRVTLTGDGYFDVVHDIARPFVVLAGNAVARDLGTSFAVRARGDAAVSVAVRDGQVALSGAKGSVADAVVLGANDVGQVDGAGRATTVRRGVPLDAYLGWTEGRLVFEATPLMVVAAQLSRWYDVDVRLEGDGIAERQFTAEFHGEPISKVLPMIQASLGLELRGDGRHYVLRAR